MIKNSAKALQSSIGKKITAIDLNEERLLFTFIDGTKMQLSDEGQSCCEYRYLHSDDDIQAFIGSELINAEVLEGPYTEDKDGFEVHEIAFLAVRTNYGTFTIETHNEHNGYYGGFLINAAIVD